MDQQLISAISLVKASKYRQHIVMMLHNTIFTPAEIQQKLDIRINHVSLYLKELKEANIVICLNEDTKKGRLYTLSDLGNELYGYITSSNNHDE